MTTPPPDINDPPQPASPTYALWADRVIAALVDQFFVLIVTVIFYVIFGFIFGAIGAAGAALGNNTHSQAAGAVGATGGLISIGACCLLFVLFPAVTFLIGLYNKVYLVHKRGYSIGQGMMKLEVIDKDQNRPSNGTLIIRLLAQIGIALIPIGGILDLLWPLWDRQRQTLHDKAVGTFVIKRS